MQPPPDWPQRVAKAVNEWKQSPDPFGREYDMLFDKFVYNERAESWAAFCAWSEDLQGWGFRGQREAEWTLQTSLEFMIRVKHSRGHYHLDREVEGRELLSRFRQQAPEYIRNPPSSDDLASWLALMQHHGVPTRLLDWTESSHVALYFAIEHEPHGVKAESPTKEGFCAGGEPDNEGKCSAVWAINLKWLEKRGREALGSEGGISIPDDPDARIQYLNGLLGQKEKPLIVRIDPPDPNEHDHPPRDPGSAGH